MGRQTTFHSATGNDDFLGLRISRAGTTEIVYEDGAAHRMIWRVASGLTDEGDIAEAMSLAVKAPRVVPALYEELKKRAIAIERLMV